MMGFSQILNKFREMKDKVSDDSPINEVPEDRVLSSLRRQRQKQLNEMEKAKLKQDIKHYNKRKMEILMGYTGKPSNNMLRDRKNKKFLHDDKPLMKQKARNINVFKK